MPLPGKITPTTTTIGHGIRRSTPRTKVAEPAEACSGAPSPHFTRYVTRSKTSPRAWCVCGDCGLRLEGLTWCHQRLRD